MIWGNQKWKGAAPSLSNKAVIIKGEIEKDKDKYKHLDMIIKVDPKAWIRKYFNAVSEYKGFILIKIRGINDKRLISKPIHIPNQEEEETVKKEPKRRVNINMKDENGKII